MKKDLLLVSDKENCHIVREPMERLHGKDPKVTSIPWLTAGKKIGPSNLYPQGAKFCHQLPQELGRRPEYQNGIQFN